jgi:hypothetical protein
MKEGLDAPIVAPEVDMEALAERLDYAAWKGFNQSESEFEKGYKHAMSVAARVVREAAPAPTVAPQQSDELAQWSSVDNWPLPDVLNKLADATECLLGDYNYDRDGWEQLKYAALAARRHIQLHGQAWQYTHERDAELIRKDGMMCEAHPGLEFGHDPNCGGPGTPWVIEGRSAIESLAAPASPAALTSTRSNREPHPFQEHPLYPNYCAFAVGDEDYCKRETDDVIHQAPPSAAIRDEAGRQRAIQLLRKLREGTDPAEVERQKESWRQLEEDLSGAETEQVFATADEFLDAYNAAATANLLNETEKAARQLLRPDRTAADIESAVEYIVSRVEALRRSLPPATTPPSTLARKAAEENDALRKEAELIAVKWAETLSEGEQSVLLTSSIRRLRSMITAIIERYFSAGQTK